MNSYVVMINVNILSIFTPYKLYPVISGEVKSDWGSKYPPEVLRSDRFIIMDIMN